MQRMWRRTYCNML